MSLEKNEQKKRISEVPGILANNSIKRDLRKTTRRSGRKNWGGGVLLPGGGRRVGCESPQGVGTFFQNLQLIQDRTSGGGRSGGREGTKVRGLEQNRTKRETNKHELLRGLSKLRGGRPGGVPRGRPLIRG